MKISEQAKLFVFQAERDCDAPMRRIDAVEFLTLQRVLQAFQDEHISPRHFAPSTGYGYDDIGRDALDRVFAHALEAEAAIVSPFIVNGTHAIFLALDALTECGDAIVSLSGDPYDTLLEAIGIRGASPLSLRKKGVSFRSVPMPGQNKMPDINDIKSMISDKTKIVYIQRSRGYAWRNAISVPEIAELIRQVRQIKSDVYIVIDNCYGEFTEANEPTAFGADVIAGSLIKNPGGGLVPTGGYVAGSSLCIARIAERLTVPSLGREVGSYAGDYRPFFQGLFMAPHTTAQCLKSAVLFARVFEQMGIETMPTFDAPRSDIIQAIQFGSADKLIRFCQSIQGSAPIDSYVTPEPWDMPGYADKVIMAAGTFVQGATTELSADGPIRTPYIAYLQGALSYAHAKLAAMHAYDSIIAASILP